MKTPHTSKRKWWTRLCGFLFSRREARPAFESLLETTKDHETKEGDVEQVGVRELTPEEQKLRESLQWLMENPDLQASALRASRRRKSDGAG